ncbi:MAG TPA: hypothetical protein VNO30_26505 [Kofleriaceae bacterium]|nr:hypothetical protein [Kofleriaceae bacterium]
MNQRCLDLAILLGGQRAALGPGARSLGINSFLTWDLIRIGMASDEQLRVLAEDLELTQAATERRGRIWWRTAEARKEGLVIVAAGPHHEGKPPEVKP